MRRRALRRRPLDPERARRVAWVAAVALVALVWGLGLCIPALDREELQARRAAWRTTGEREEAPAAASGGTRTFQERN